MIDTPPPGKSRNRRTDPRDKLRAVLKTGDAADYCGISPGLLRKKRLMGPDDPGDHGPPFIRISEFVVVYEIAALDAWLAERHAARPSLDAAVAARVAARAPASPRKASVQEAAQADVVRKVKVKERAAANEAA